jgi:predicted tellurium resistance membrane protein TerC
LHYVIPKGYIYFAVAFSLLIEFINIKIRGKSRIRPIKLNKKYS